MYILEIRQLKTRQHTNTSKRIKQKSQASLKTLPKQQTATWFEKNAVKIPLWGHSNPCTLHPISAGFTGLCPSGTGNRSSVRPLMCYVSCAEFEVKCLHRTWLVDEYHLWVHCSAEIKRKKKSTWFMHCSSLIRTIFVHQESLPKSSPSPCIFIHLPEKRFMFQILKRFDDLRLPHSVRALYNHST